jgi:[ribosomal protein S5]-alanine N-acetyltransferase
MSNEIEKKVISLLWKPQLESKNIILRSSSFKDCSLFSNWEAKEYVRAFLVINDTRDNEEIIREFVIRDMDSTKMQYTIVCAEDMIPIGRIYISNFDRNVTSIDITRIYIGEEQYLGKGYGREAMKLLLSYFFYDLKLERVTIDFFVDNKRAEMLYKSLGFKSEGILRHIVKKNSTFINLHLMSLLRQEYLDLNPLK